MSDPYTEEQAGLSTRISVFNLDPVEQSKLWLQVGPTEARRILVGVLRTALLFGGTVVVDRNQLLEGIFFIAMPPERLAWHLGLEPGAPLPIEVQLLPAPSSSSTAPGPWRLSGGKHSWGVDDDLVSAIEANHAAIREDLHRVSSPLIALTGGAYERASEASQRSHSSSGAEFEKAWRVSDPVVVPQSLWDARDIEVAKTVRESGRSAWVKAMRDGRIRVLSSARLGPNPLGPELDTELPPNFDQVPEVDELVAALMNLEYANDVDRSKTAPCQVVHSGHAMPCQRAHVTTRSLVTRWLDGEHLEQLTPPQLPEPLQHDGLAVHRSSALGWWTLAYNRAICNRDGLRLLTIYNALPSPSGIRGDDANAAELAWGLRRPPETFWSRMRARVRRRPRTAVASTLPIAGDIVTRLAAFMPGEYSRLQAFDAVGSSELLRKPGRRSLFDLVVAIDEIAGDTTSRSRRMRSTILRGGVVTIGGLSIVLYDNGFIALSGPVWAVAAFVAASLLATPWSDFGALRRMSGSRLQSTLRFQP
ncbi:hypothetical protein [Arthrobacter flavus]|uniref:Uncharacterized protein n=1 Tax=Arthrobacter flavus TaxID=95172 RepID=A0ABW4Q722_9MICC